MCHNNTNKIHNTWRIQETSEINASLLERRKQLLKKHEDLGIIRQHSDNYYAAEETKLQRTKLHETIDSELSDEDLRLKLRRLSRQRLLKVWYDRSEIAGHSHLLVLVAAVYDPAFYCTPQEMQQKGKNIDVPMIVEEPEIHILSCSCSTLCD